ncbi:PREDICTED: uncharacterized protein LOC105362845 [Ceratosolen solmsi marchali]|uniref:Uncharacterized protein LOC105362845 n=1 Tax=Ceratosolen solmsi marchali TaxID=326594 RepID=A0AAJ6YIH9_9HYME|nr:PREDICTED: uncharacterized protein LOC105362845 [Ceratosolen solmsi marchali]
MPKVETWNGQFIKDEPIDEQTSLKRTQQWIMSFLNSLVGRIKDTFAEFDMTRMFKILESIITFNSPGEYHSKHCKNCQHYSNNHSHHRHCYSCKRNYEKALKNRKIILNKKCAFSCQGRKADCICNSKRNQGCCRNYQNFITQDFCQRIDKIPSCSDEHCHGMNRSTDLSTRSSTSAALKACAIINAVASGRPKRRRNEWSDRPTTR